MKAFFSSKATLHRKLPLLGKVGCKEKGKQRNEKWSNVVKVYECKLLVKEIKQWPRTSDHAYVKALV